MLITDGAPYHYEEIFKAKQDPANYVRMFTYLIGREVTDKREVMWMACAHKGNNKPNRISCLIRCTGTIHKPFHVLLRIFCACDNLGRGARTSAQVHAGHVKTNGDVQNAQRFLDPSVC